MEHAWLDSLSEDWVSQPGSDRSPAVSAPANPESSRKIHLDSRAGSSRIPRRSHGPTTENSSNILGERSASEINISYPRRTPSKLAQELQASERDASRTVSVSTTDSVIHNTVEHRSTSRSPAKSKGHTPEWKRRLVYGNLPYGEQRDLFSSAGTGLENIFKPPAPPAPREMLEELEEEEEEEQDEEELQEFPNETTLPSSPPIRSAHDSSLFHDDRSSVEHLHERQPPRPKTRVMQYRAADDGSVEPSGYSALGHSEDDASRESAAQDSSQLSRPSTVAYGAQEDRKSRMFSGGSVLRNEDFSPIPISPEKPIAGSDKQDFAALEVPPDELRKRLEKLRRNQMMLADELDSAIDGPTSISDKKSFNIENTQDFERAGGFINFRRGGRSADGSFRHRLLSPPLNIDTSEMFPEDSVQASTPKEFPTLRMGPPPPPPQANSRSPPLPRVPNPSPQKGGAPSGHGAGGSPLKLFGPYDTFTNQTLMRRISQFENQMSDNSQASVVRPAGPPADGQSQSDSWGSSVVHHKETAGTRQGLRHQNTSAQFGIGDLDGYEFNDEFSRLSEDASANDDETEGEDGFQRSPVQEPSLFPSDIDLETSPPEPEELIILRRRDKSTTTTAATSTRSSKFRTISLSRTTPDTSFHAHPGPRVLATPKQRDAGSEGKRPRTSPSKDPTPKRRRTLHKSDVAYGVDGPQLAVHSAQSSHHHMQSIMSRKRRDARDGDRQQLANPNVLATRQILRPRTPTPSQRSSIQREKNPYVANIDGSGSETEPSRTSVTPTPQRGSPGRPSASVSDPDRKPSIKTEDFMQEANKIMAMLRNRAGIQSGLTSVEESESENMAVPPPAEEADGSFQESTKEPFSRPPSRDGRPLPRTSMRQEDPELAARLKKYEERSDIDDLISSSARSISLAQDAIRATRAIEDHVKSTISRNSVRLDLTGDGDVSDPPNIRISANPALRRKTSQDYAGGATTTGSMRDGFTSQASSSSGHSTGRSIPTGSSRGSDTRKTIAPQTVSHLIPDEVGNMILDRDRNIWVKRKHNTPMPKLHTVLPSEGSEDDPFADIPDLTVDMTVELQNMRVAKSQEAAREQQDAAAHLEAQSPAKPTSIAMPAKLDVSPSRGAKAASLANGTKTTAAAPSPTKSPKVVTAVHHREYHEEVVEHEISINEDRVSLETPPKRKSMTISFSSPIASIIQDVIIDKIGNEAVNDESLADISISSLRQQRRKSSLSAKSGRRRSNSGSRSNSRGASRQLSVGGHAFVPRPVSRIDEREEDGAVVHSQLLGGRELSLVGDQSDLGRNLDMPSGSRRASLSFVVTTPGRGRVATHPDQGQIITQYVGTLSLSPLSDFTIHRDQSTLGFEASYIHDERHLVTGDGSKAVMSQTLRDLVNTLTEVEPFEPYWEDIEELDLHDRRLSSLHKLDEFCQNLVTIDVSGNDLRNLNGMPSPVRHLKVVCNQLSELTSWNHLANLQYLDISNNDIKTLAGLKNLVHLRSLKADNCNLTSLDAFKYHDAIQSLRARSNAIQSVDLDGTRLQRLTDLDLEGNAIESITHLDQLPCLSTLNLRGNKLEDFTIPAGQALASLRVLDLSDNGLSTLDIGLLPSLRIVYADRNRLTRVRGFSKTPRLDTVSLREQASPPSEHLDITSLYHAYEIRKLYLSGNYLEAFHPPVDFLNLQLLELANCGLTSLPDELGQMMPNLRKANLNFNALSDLGSLRHVPRLKKLAAAGNRLANAYSAVEVLATFPHLAEVDLRDNPITQGFYAPPTRVVVATSGGAKAKSAPAVAAAAAVEPFTLPDEDVARDRAYCGRLDLETGMRRRMYGRITGEACRRLKKLDGLPLDREAGRVRDAVWMALAAQGVLAETEGGVELEGVAADQRADGQRKEKDRDESRWGAEDSFA